MSNEKVKLNKRKVQNAADKLGLTIAEMCEQLNTSPQTHAYRYKKGWPIAEAEYLARFLKINLKKLLDD